VRKKFKENLFESGWLKVLEPFIDSEKFDILINGLEEAQNNTGLTPELKDIFRLFYKCPYDKFKVVIAVSDPYHEKDAANGIALCCGKTEIVDQPLTEIFEEIQSTVYADEGGWYLWQEDLTRWANQGILMLNTSLTTQPGKKGMHYELWKPFTSFLFKRIGDLNKDIIYMFLDKNVESWSKGLPDCNHIIFSSYDTSGISKNPTWCGDNMFVKANEILESTNRTKIIW
jgi:uracil-DNA glycosylase